jgi:glycopeptide antibiotics resistance protein
MLKPAIFRKLLYSYIIVTLILLIIPNKGSEISMDDVHILNFLRLDYLVHVILFLPLVPLWRTAMPGHPCVLVIPGALLFAVFSEFLHLLLPYRGYNINDLAANIAGVILGVPVALLLGRVTAAGMAGLGEPVKFSSPDKNN